MDRWIGRMIGRRMHGWMDGCIVKRMDGRTDNGWMDR